MKQLPSDLHKYITERNSMYDFLTAAYKGARKTKNVSVALKLAKGLQKWAEEPSRTCENNDALGVAMIVSELADDTAKGIEATDRATQALMTLALRALDHDRAPEWLLIRYAETYASSGKSKTLLGKVKARDKARDRKRRSYTGPRWYGNPI